MKFGYNDPPPLSFLLQLALHQNSFGKLNYHKKRPTCTDWLKLAICFLNLLPSFGWNVLPRFYFSFVIWICISLIALGSNDPYLLDN